MERVIVLPSSRTLPSALLPLLPLPLCMSVAQVALLPCTPLPMAQKQWKVTFENVQDPDVMKAKLESCPFFKKCGVPKKVSVEGSNVIFTFTAPIDRQGVQQKCNQTFRQYGPFQKYQVEEMYVQMTDVVQSAAGHSK